MAGSFIIKNTQNERHRKFTIEWKTSFHDIVERIFPRYPADTIGSEQFFGHGEG